MDDASVEPIVMPLGLLRKITNGFSEERKLGSGTFGKVYEGVYQDGKKIAVKMLFDMPGLDDHQFQNEFKHLARLRHQNIVRLVGYCHDIQKVQVQYEGKLVLAEKTHRVLCLEFMSNGSLEKFLSDKCDRYDWHTCYRIIKGICQGLKYLHNESIYHLDLKPANVLLDENMVPRIADFGISKLFSDENTWATNSSLGTCGYSPPEFIRSRLISNKSDIFSLGVVIIKMMAGRKGYFSTTDMSSQEFTNLVRDHWTNRLLETSNRRNAYSEQVKICIEIGLSCVQEDRHKRPTIQDIIFRLEESETKCTAAARKDLLLTFQEKPSIDGIKIVGDSRLGSTLKACVAPTNGTIHYKFQWVRCLEHGNTQPIEGATTYDYMVSADDVGTLLAVDCTPVDKDRREGDMVRVFADCENKITCGEEIPPLSQQQPTVPAALQRQSVFATLMLRQKARESSKNFHLRFLNGLKTPIYTQKNIKSESNSTIRIGIFDGDGNMITEGPLSKVKVEMLVLRGDFCNDGRESWTEEEFNSHIADFCNDGRESWTEEEFNSHIAQGRHGQGFVLGGDCSVWLNNGEASFGGAIRFKEGSSRTRSRMFNVAARVCMDGKATDRVREAVMMPVTVLDRRNEANEKRHPPKLEDEVYRLEEIFKDGTYHERLEEAHIFTVQDFLKALNKDANKLCEEVLRMKKPNNSWERMVMHARECSLTNSHQLIAYLNEAANAVLFFNCVYELVGAEFAGVYVARENFDAAKKALANELKERARDKLDSAPFSCVMNGSLPVLLPSTENSFVSMPILTPDAALQGSQSTRFNNLHLPHYAQRPELGSAMEASTSAQNNLLRQQFLPTQFQESMRGMHYPADVPNPVAQSLQDPEPSVFPFPGADYGSF